MTKSIIEQLREFDGVEGDDWYTDDTHDLIEGLLYPYKKPYEVAEVHSEFEEGGRWSNYEKEVYKVTEGGNVAYFEMSREVPATEMQEGGDFSWGFSEVTPVEKTVIVYE